MSFRSLALGSMLWAVSGCATAARPSNHEQAQDDAQGPAPRPLPVVTVGVPAPADGRLASLEPTLPEPLAQDWSLLSSWFNGRSAHAADNAWFVFSFGSLTHEALAATSSSLASEWCDTDQGDAFVHVTQIESDDFVSLHLPDIVESTRLALVGWRTPPRDVAARLDGLEVTLGLAAQTATSLWSISSTGDCQGAWSHNHWVLYTENGPLSVSLGGGE